MTFQELVELMYDRGCNLADVAIGRMMDMIEEETGIWPDWDEIAPDWSRPFAVVQRRIMDVPKNFSGRRARRVPENREGRRNRRRRRRLGVA